LTETDTAAEGTTVASESDSGSASTTDSDSGSDWSTVTDTGVIDSSGYTGSFTEVDTDGGSVTDHDQETDTDSNGADTGSDQVTTTEQDNATASFTSGGTYVNATTGMTATVSEGDLTHDSITESDSESDTDSFASGSFTPSSEAGSDTDYVSDTGSDSDSSSEHGTLPGGVTFTVTTGAADSFSDTDHEQDTDNGTSDTASVGDSGSDAGTATYSMSEGGSIGDSTPGEETAYIDDSFDGLTGSFTLTDSSTAGYSDSEGGSDTDTAADTVSDTGWSAALGGGDSATHGDSGSETISYSASGAGTGSSYTDSELDTSTYSDHDVGSDTTSGGSTTSQDTLTATDAGSVINDYWSSISATGASTEIEESNSDAYSDHDVDSESFDATGAVASSSSDDTHDDNGAYSFTMTYSSSTTSMGTTTTVDGDQEYDGTYDDQTETVNGTASFSNNDSGESSGNSTSTQTSTGTTLFGVENADDTWSYQATGVTSSGSTGYTALSYYDDNYSYSSIGFSDGVPPIWESTEVVTTEYGAGTDFTTSIDRYTDGSELTGGGGGGGGDGADFRGGGGFGGGGGFHPDLFGSGGSESETDYTSSSFSTPPPETDLKQEEQACFPAGTLVSTETGLRPIEAIRKGERVWAFDHAVGEWMLRSVLECYESTCQGKIVAISVAKEVIEATLGHPFWVVEGPGLAERNRPEHSLKAPAKSCLSGRWVDAGDLQVGDVLLLKHNKRQKIKQVATRQASEKVYNFKVEQLHCYAVGTNQVLVHNNSALTEAEPSSDWEWEHWWNPFSYPAIIAESVALPAVDVYDWWQTSKIDAKLKELEDKRAQRQDWMAPLQKPSTSTSPPTAFNMAREGYDLDANRRWNNSLGPLKTLASIGMIWDAGAGTWVSSSGAKFAFRGGKWTETTSGRVATNEELAAIRQAELKATRSFSRALTVEDLGVKGTIQELKGTLSVTNGKAVVRIDMIKGQITNPLEIVENLMNTARAKGAQSLRIEATLANERLFNVLRKRYGMQSMGGIDYIDFPLGK
jgi:hypothetical protein